VFEHESLLGDIQVAIVGIKSFSAQRLAAQPLGRFR
jgi:hypothetical protein